MAIGKTRLDPKILHTTLSQDLREPVINRQIQRRPVFNTTRPGNRLPRFKELSTLASKLARTTSAQQFSQMSSELVADEINTNSLIVGLRPPKNKALKKIDVLLDTAIERILFGLGIGQEFWKPGNIGSTHASTRDGMDGISTYEGPFPDIIGDEGPLTPKALSRATFTQVLGDVFPEFLITLVRIRATEIFLRLRYTREKIPVPFMNDSDPICDIWDVEQAMSETPRIQSLRRDYTWINEEFDLEIHNQVDLTDASLATTKKEGPKFHDFVRRINGLRIMANGFLHLATDCLIMPEGRAVSEAKELNPLLPPLLKQLVEPLA